MSYTAGACFAFVLEGKPLYRSVPMVLRRFPFHLWLVALEDRWKAFCVNSVEMLSNLAAYQKYWREESGRNICEGFFSLGPKGNRNGVKWVKWFRGKSLEQEELNKKICSRNFPPLPST